MPQDDVRERELVNLFNLAWDPDHQRHGNDATLTVEASGIQYSIDVEVKSTTNYSVGTARDVGLDHIEKWRRKFFVIGIYSSGPRADFQTALCLTPTDIGPWIDKIEKKIGPDFLLAEYASQRLQIEDLYKVCEEKAIYTVADAKRIHKMQWSTKEYQHHRDLTQGTLKGYSPERMLEIIRLRSKYIAERGSTLNNPKIEKSIVKSFLGTDREFTRQRCAAGMQTLAINFIAQNPGHIAVRKLDASSA
jgi:hypothetical protein